MATYNQLQMAEGGVLGEALTAGTTYTFTFTTPTFTSQSVYGGDAYFILNSSVGGNPLLSPITAAGPLNTSYIPLSNGTISCDANRSATINVTSNFNRGSAVLEFTSVGWDETLGSLTGKITHARVIDGGLNFRTGDEIEVPRGTPGIQGLGFTNADKPAELDVFTNYIADGYAIDADFNGEYNNPTGDVRMEQFASSSNSDGSIFNVGFNLKQSVGSGNGDFRFTPNVDIAANSYTIQSTGHYTLTIA